MIFFSRVDLIGAGDDWFIQGKCLQLEQRKYSRDFIFWNIIIHVNLRPVSKGILTKFRKLSGKYHWWESLLEKLLVTGLQLFWYRLRAEILLELSIFFFQNSYSVECLGTTVSCIHFPTGAGVYLLKVNDENTRTMFKICSKLTIKTTNYVPSLSILNKFHTFLSTCEQVIVRWVDFSPAFIIRSRLHTFDLEIEKNICRSLGTRNVICLFNLLNTLSFHNFS